MKEKNNIKDDLIDDLAPQLSKIGKSNGFEVPEGYFEELPYVLQHKCVIPIKEKKIGLILKPIYIVQYSLFALFLFLGVYFLIKNNVVEPDTNFISDNSSNIYQNDVAVFDDDTDESELIEVIANNTEIDLQPIIMEDTSPLNMDDIINYLIDDTDFDIENEF